jgi:tetratricopeptide (TPR) repeat protein
MLETIREHALDRLHASGEEASLRAAHARFYRELALAAEPHLTGPDQLPYLDELRREKDNLRAAGDWLLAQGETDEALRLAAGVWRFWYATGNATEGSRWLDATLALPETKRDDLKELRARVLQGRSALAVVQADLIQGEGLARETLQLMRELGDTAGVAAALNSLANMLRNRGEAERAVPLYQESLALYRQLDDRRGVSATLNNLGTAVRQLGDTARAAELHENSLELRRVLGDTWGVALILMNLGAAALEQGDLKRARSAADESLRLSEQLRNTHGVALAVDVLARVALVDGDWPRAAALFSRSLSLCGDVGDRGLAADGLIGLAEVVSRVGSMDSAVRLLAAGCKIQESLGRVDNYWKDRRREVAAVARASLGDAAFDAAWGSGGAMVWEEAVQAAVSIADVASSRRWME